jgi:hypothetical protein
MTISSENIQFIKDSFTSLKSNEDFLSLLNYTKVLVYGEKAIPFQLKQLTYHANPKKNRKRYIKFVIKKKSGADRIINAPNKGLKAIQKCLNVILQTVYESHLSKAATGFVPNKSIVDNAILHANMHYVYNIDLKDFFPSIDQARVWKRLQFPPFNFNDTNNNVIIANTIAGLCCHKMEVERIKEGSDEFEKVVTNVLPQGAPTSPTMSNIICQQLDFYLTALAKRFGLRYTRYADDITFSSLHNVYQKDSDFLIELSRIVSSQHFHIKASKTRLQKEGYKQEVTGLIVNSKPNVSQHYIKELRMRLHYWEKYGYDKAEAMFLPNYLADKGHLKGFPNMKNVLMGKLDFLKMVKGGENSTYLALKSRFDKLVGNMNTTTEIVMENNFSLSNLINIWQSKGINEAIKLSNYTNGG